MEKIHRVLGGQSVPETVINSLISYILEHTLKPGDRLPSERNMAESLGVSRTSLKKAIQILSHYDILESRPQSGVYVKDLTSILEFQKSDGQLAQRTREDIEWHECRECLEPSVCRLCAVRIAPAELAELNASLKKMQRHCDEQDLSAFLLEDYCFHRICMRATHNQSLCEMYSNYCGDIYQWMVSAYDDYFAKIVPAAMEQHYALYAAIAAHDGERAYDIAREHTGMSSKTWKTDSAKGLSRVRAK